MEVQETGKSLFANKWVQLAIGVVCMASVANLQYGWTLFVAPLDAKYHWGREAIQTAFFLFVLVETWLVPIEGYLVDRFGPRIVVLGGGVLIGCAWALNSVADTLVLLYAGAVLGGVGAGCVYGTCVGNAIKWFPGQRGLAAGVTAAGFGAGAALTIVPISNMIKSSGYEHAFMFFGILQGVIVLVMACGLLGAPAHLKSTARVAQSKRDYAPKEVLRSPVFWVMYLMFVLVAAGGTMMAASIGPIAKDFKIDGVTVTLMGVALPALSFALSLDRIFDGIGRPFFGWVSDRIGREPTMFIAFTIGAVALFALSQVGANATLFVLLTALYFGVYGEIFSLFPATQGDTFGSKFAAANAGMLYTAKGTGALAVPIAAAVAHSRGWPAVFDVAMVFNAVAALLAVLVLRPMRAKHLAASAIEPEEVAVVPTPVLSSNRH